MPRLWTDAVKRPSPVVVTSAPPDTLKRPRRHDPLGPRRLRFPLKSLTAPFGARFQDREAPLGTIPPTMMKFLARHRLHRPTRPYAVRVGSSTPSRAHSYIPQALKLAPVLDAVACES